MSDHHASFEIPAGLPSIVDLARSMWGDPTRVTPEEVEFGSRGSKKVRPHANTWFDHEAATGGGYLQLYRLKHGELPPAARGGFRIPAGMRQELGDPTAWWDYQAEDGTTVARVVRFDPPSGKTYRQCRPEGGDRWSWKMGKLKIPVYHLPEIIAAPDNATVYITEGEKHADLLRSWGLLATTNAGGASKFRAHHAAVVARFQCVILPDNDDAGRAHAQVVTAELRRAGCQSIRVLNLPGLPAKGDVMDWAAAGGTREAFLQLAADAQPSDDQPRDPETQGDDHGSDEEPPGDISDPGYDAALNEAVAAAQKPANDQIDALVAEFNAQFLVVNEAGKAVIYSPAFDQILGRRYYTRLSFGDLRQLYLNRRIEIGIDDKGRPLFRPAAEIWLHSPERRQFIRGVTFDPSGAALPAGVLNLWTGFAIEPRPGSWRLMQRHILHALCKGDRAHYAYLIAWMARMIQRPAEQGEVAVVLRGKEGTGKGIVARALLRIMGQHGLQIANAKHLVGNFNSHLRDCVFLFADEAFFAGDKAHTGVLKNIVTERALAVEAKYQNAVQAPNFLHLFMASNEEWVVPASLEARRFFILEVSDAHRGDHAYFGALQREMDEGGVEAMLHDLQQLDLAGFNARDVPQTEGLNTQRRLSLGTAEAWWLDVLQRGYVFETKLGLTAYFGRWHDQVTTDLLYASYEAYAASRREWRPMDRERFGQFMREVGGKSVRPRNAVVGEHIGEVSDGFGVRRQPTTTIKDRCTGYSFGSLEAARDGFIDHTKLAIEWEQVEQVEAGTDE